MKKKQKRLISFETKTAPETYFFQKCYDLAVSINFIANKMILAAFL